MSEFDPFGHAIPDLDLAVLRRLSKGCEVAVEIGSWVGSTARVLAENCSRVYCVDLWERIETNDTLCNSPKAGRPAFETFCRNFNGDLFTRIFPCRGSSEWWSGVWPFAVDLVFIDADHHYRFVKQDIERWLPHVKEGGILCGHDYDICNGVNRAVDELLPQAHKDNFVWWIRKGEQ